MPEFKQLATAHPIVFGLAITLIAWLLLIVTGVSAQPAPSRYGQEIVWALGELAGTLFFLYVLSRFGWLGAAGITRLGGWKSWLLVLPAMLYTLIVGVYAFFGGFSLDISDPALAGAVALNNMAGGGLFEETVYRGVILYALVRLWGSSRRGIVKSAPISALLFAGAHIIRILVGKPVVMTLLQVAETVVSGFYLAAFVLHVGSIWPAVLVHGLGNALGNVMVLGIPAFEETASAWVLLILSDLPVVIFGAYLLYRLSPRPVVPDAA